MTPLPRPLPSWVARKNIYNTETGIQTQNMKMIIKYIQMKIYQKKKIIITTKVKTQSRLQKISKKKIKTINKNHRKTKN